MTTVDQPGVREVFVGRTDLLAYLSRSLDEGQTLRADDVVGAVGMGKTSLLHHLFARRTATGTPREWLVDLAAYVTAPPGRSTTHASVDEARHAYEALKRLAGTLAGGVDPGHARRLAPVLAEADGQVAAAAALSISVSTTMTASGSASISSSPQSIGLTLDAGALEEHQLGAIRAAGRAVATGLAECLNAADVERPLVLLVDNVHLVARTELATWIEEAIERLRDAVVVLAHEPQAGIDLPDAVVRRVQIPPLTKADVARYLEERGCADPSEPELASLLHTCSGGVPAAVKLLVDLLMDPAASLRPHDLRCDLLRLTPDPQARITRVVEDMVTRLHGADLLTALRVVSITRQCDAPLLERLMAEAGARVTDTAELMASLEAFSFTDEFWGPAPWGRAPTGLAPPRAYYVAVHPFVATGVTDHLRRYDPGLLRRLHAVAARYSYEQLTSTDDYGSKFLYEDPTYQLAARAWLCHLARASEDPAGLRRIARIYLDAFWWFGSYVQLAFCDQLVEDVRTFALEAGTADEAGFADALHHLHRRFPRRDADRRDFDPRVPDADWGAVRDALCTIQETCRVNGDPTDDAGTAVLALSEVYIAETFRHDAPDLTEAMESYDRADAALASLGRTWDRAWVAFYRADALLEHDRVDDAAETAATAARLLAEVDDPVAPDEELAANLHRVRGDCAWHRGAHLDAAREYAGAVLHAYLFHGVGGPPDTYTTQLYFEVRGRVLARLVALHAEAPERVPDVLSALADAVPARLPWPRPTLDQIRPALAADDRATLAPLLFPEGPADDDLGVDASAFMRTVRTFARGVRRTTHGPAPRAP